MPRSLRVQPDCLDKVKLALRRNVFPSQRYFGDPDRGKEVKEAFKQNLLEIQRKRTAGRATIPSEEVYKRYGIAKNELFS